MKYSVSMLLFLFAVSSLFTQQREWKNLETAMGESVWASSSLTETIRGKTLTYGPDNLFDGDTASPWVEGADGPGYHESVLIQTQQIVRELDLTNGFASSSGLYQKNNRIKDFSLSFVAGFTAPGLVTEQDYTLYFTLEQQIPARFSLSDSRDSQRISLEKWESLQDDFYREVLTLFAGDYPDFYEMILKDLGISPEEGESLMYQKLILEVYGFFGIRLTIGEIYRGSHYDDTCLSEISLTLEEF